MTRQLRCFYCRQPIPVTTGTVTQVAILHDSDDCSDGGKDCNCSDVAHPACAQRAAGGES
ncbi:MAG TPA: hypothetical protein VGO93_28660 [Candidatus Xenobia bacterium]|jgi:hypothetical protein